MSCEINLIAYLQDIPAIRRCLFPTDDKRGSDTWLQQCKISASSTGELIALANERRLVILTAKWDLPDSICHFQITYSGSIHEYDKVKAVLCLPVANEIAHSSHISPDWTCIVIGYDSGYVRFYTESCELILEDQLHNENITNIKCQSQHAPRPDLCQELHIEELYVQYKSTLCVLNGSELFTQLRACRSRLGHTKNDLTELPQVSLNVKKWGFQDQSLINDSAVVGLNLSNTFDHLLTASVCGGFDTKYRSVAPNNTLILAAGSRPFLGYHYAIEGVNQPVFSDVAKVVATKLKSALPSWLTNNTNQQEKQKTTVIQPVDGMICRFGLCDLHRTGSDVILTPNHKIAVVSDSLGRVLLIDAYRGIALKMLKGYREAQCAIVQVADERKSKHKIGNKVAHFLVIYSPKKGTLEIFIVQSGQKVATFSASKYSRLLYIDYNLMGFNSVTKSKYICQFTTLFIESEGGIKEISIPFHFALEENSSKRVRDIHLYRKLREMIKIGNFNSQAISDMQKIYSELQTLEIKNQTIELLLNSKQVLGDMFLQCVEHFLGCIGENDNEPSSVQNFKTLCTNILLLLRLYKFIEVSLENHLKNEENGNGEEMAENSLNLNSKELMNLQKLLDLNAASEKCDRKGPHVRFSSDLNNCYSVSEFIGCFNIMNEESISLKSDIEDNLLFKTAEVLYKPYIKAILSNFENLGEIMLKSKIRTKDLMFLLLNYWVNRILDINLDLEKEMANLSKVIHTLVKTAQKDIVTTEYNSISNFWSEIRKILANTAKPFPALMAAILCKSVAQSLENESSYSEEDNIEILSQENVEWSILIGKLEDISLLNIVLSINSSVNNNCLPALNYQKQDISLKCVLEKGKGAVSELVAQWLASSGVNPDLILMNEIIFINNSSKIKNDEYKDIEICEGMHLDKIEEIKCEPIFQYLNILKAQFPYSLEASTLLANMCWEYCLAWQKNIEILSNLEAAIKCLKCIKNIKIKCGMYQLVWNAHLKIIIEGACKLINKVGKLPKEKLCRQDTGMSDSEISAFIVICTEFLDEFIDIAQSCCNAPLLELQFEQLWENEEQALVELAAQQKEVDYNLIHLHYQLTLVLQMITKFSIKHSKPINNLFESSIVSLFFTDMQRKVHLNISTESKVTASRTQFLCKVILASLETVTINEENQIYCSEHVDWMSKCLTLARIWNLDIDMLRRYQVVQLFASGFDLIGEELIPAISDLNSLGLELLVVASKRLSQFISSSPDLSQNIAALSPTLTRYMESLDNGQWFAPSSLGVISNLASHILRCLELSKNQKEYKLAELLAEACSNLEEIN